VSEGLRIYRDDYTWYVAKDEAHAVELRTADMGAEDGEESGPMRLCDDPLRMRDEDEGDVTRTHEEWIRAFGGKPGAFASTET
jgi:hypothetical protein